MVLGVNFDRCSICRDLGVLLIFCFTVVFCGVEYGLL